MRQTVLKSALVPGYAAPCLETVEFPNSLGRGRGAVNLYDVHGGKADAPKSLRWAKCRGQLTFPEIRRSKFRSCSLHEPLALTRKEG